MSEKTALTPITSAPLALAGMVADQVRAHNALGDYQARKAKNTLLRQEDDLCLFKTYLESVPDVGDVGDFYHDIDAWRPITAGLVASFVGWQLQRGYAVGSVNVRLATIKAYARIALDAQVLSPDDYTRIKSVKGYGGGEAINVDRERSPRRVSTKKEVAVSVSPVHIELLKKVARTIRPADELLVCLLCDMGLRIGEIAALTRDSFDLAQAQLKFYREKVHKDQTHALTPDTLLAAQRYLATLPSGQVSLFNMTTRALFKRVRRLGALIDLPTLSPHDCRHAWATDAARNKTSVFALQHAGGWNSVEMPARYVEASAIANDGVILTATKNK